ncbi:MAG: 4-(cytidine 5'-diphospho)-2-C-methyl-D-erythritol kinase [Inhella sp.]
MKALYELPAPAKLNLFLHVVGKRPDGYHLLESVFVPIDWADTLHLERRDDGRLNRHDLGTPLPDDDLCLRAARALQAHSGCRWGADIHIDKQVPSGAGMGGGSSDAATVLIGLNRLWNLNLSRSTLMAIGLRLGADVPFFLGCGPAWVTGIGEQLRPVDLAPLSLAVIKPADSLPTAAIFRSPLLQFSEPQAIVAGSLANTSSLSGFSAAWREGRNDLQASAQAQSPQIEQTLLLLKRWCGNSRMTGSGSAVFAEVADDTPSVATELTQGLAALPSGWSGRVCRSLESMPLAGWVPS